LIKRNRDRPCQDETTSSKAAIKLLAGEFKPGDKIKVGAWVEELVFLKK
jgi:hypothetical protein